MTVEGFWPIFFLGVILKIPIAAALFLVVRGPGGARG